MVLSKDMLLEYFEDLPDCTWLSVTELDDTSFTVQFVDCNELYTSSDDYFGNTGDYDFPVYSVSDETNLVVLGYVKSKGNRGISLNEGHSFVSPKEALQKYSLDYLVGFMDSELVEYLHCKIAPCSDVEFLTQYLLIAVDDIIL